MSASAAVRLACGAGTDAVGADEAAGTAEPGLTVAAPTISLTGITAGTPRDIGAVATTGAAVTAGVNAADIDVCALAVAGS